MSENIRWRVLEASEWDRLAEFLLEVVGPEAVMPDPALSTVLVLVNAEDEIAAALPVIMCPIIGPVVVAEGVDEDTQDTLLSTGITALRDECASNGIVQQETIMLNTPDKHDLLGSLGFVGIDLTPFAGNL